MVEALAAEATRQELQARVTAILAEAARVDQELASAIAMATGAELIPEGPHSNDPAVQDMLTDPPEDPQQFHDAWENLSQEQRDWLYEQDHAIGNHPGMPFEDKDHYNRMHLSELQAANQAELDRLAKEHPGWTDGRPDTPNPSPPGFQEWKAQWDNANKTRQGYEQVQRALESPDGLQRYLGVIDDQGHAAVSINNPDTAIRNGTFVPGTGQDLSRLEYSASKSEAMLPALAFVKTVPQVDASRVAVWGTSFGGGHAITIASRHAELKAAVAQCPFTDGTASAGTLGLTATMRMFALVAKDQIARLRGRAATLPIAASPGELALMNAPDALPGYRNLLPPNTSWVNNTPARSILHIIRYRPGRAAKKVQVPILFCVSAADTVAPSEQTLTYAQQAPRGDVRIYDAGHFDFYLGEVQRRLATEQTEFLIGH